MASIDGRIGMGIYVYTYIKAMLHLQDLIDYVIISKCFDLGRHLPFWLYSLFANFVFTHIFPFLTGTQDTDTHHTVIKGGYSL